jgi:hypothetical protein
MGQQQLLLLVLTIVIVTIAVFIGIDLFDKSSQRQHVDELVRYSVDVASDAIAWREKKSPYLGGGGSFAQLGTGTDGLEKFLISSNRPPGQLAIEESTQNTMTIVGISTSYPELGVRMQVEGFNIVSTETYRNNEICDDSSVASEICPSS